MRTLKPSTCKKCKQVCETKTEVWVCPKCGAKNVSYTHIANDVTAGLKILTKILAKK